MKKIMLFALLMLFTSVSYSQVFHARAHTFSLHEALIDGTFKKIDESSVDISIRGEDKEVVIYSKVIQKYRIISYNGQDSNDIDSWMVYDTKGEIAKMYIKAIENSIILGIEYSDYAWVYVAKLEN
jgi:hypothetical protein